MSEPVLITADYEGRIANAVRVAERGVSRPTLGSPRINEQLYTARVTGEADDGSAASGSGQSGSGSGGCSATYPATITAWNETLCDWEDFGGCRLMPPNDETLAVGTRYRCSPAGVLADGTLLMLTASGGSCTLTLVTNVCPLFPTSYVGSGSGGNTVHPWAMEGQGGNSPFFPEGSTASESGSGGFATHGGSGGISGEAMPPVVGSGTPPSGAGDIFSSTGAPVDPTLGLVGSGSGDGSYMGGLLVEFTEYDFGACAVRRRWCVRNPNDCCGVAVPGPGSGSGSGTTPGNSGGGAIDVSDCLPDVGYLPATLTLHFLTPPFSIPSTFFTSFPMAYEGLSAEGHTWYTGLVEEGTGASYKAVNIRFYLTCKGVGDPSCHVGRVRGSITFGSYGEGTSQVADTDWPCSLNPFYVRLKAPFGDSDSFLLAVSE